MKSESQLILELQSILALRYSAPAGIKRLHRARAIAKIRRLRQCRQSIA